MATKDRANLWSLPLLDGLKLLRAYFVTHAFSRHMHDYFVVGVVEQGLQTFTYRGAYHRTPPQGLIVLNPGEAHTGEAGTEHGFVYRAFYPEVDTLQQVAREVTDRPQGIPYFGQPVIHDPALVEAIVTMHRTFENPLPALEYQTRYYWTLAQLMTRHADSRPQERRIGKERKEVQQVRRYLEDHCAEDITLTDLAALVNLSPYYLLRVFHKQVGLPPHAYLESVRVRQAQRLLDKGVPLIQVAHDTGFFDQSHFTHSFRRFIGVTPGQYAQERNILQEPIPPDDVS